VLHKRILVVDDEPLVCAALQRSLVGARVVCALNARQALERLQEDPPYDFILCDLMMPDTTGAAFYEEAVRRGVAPPERFIFMTGASAAEEFRGFLERMPQPRLEKPFTQEALWGAFGAWRAGALAAHAAATPSAAPM
jgi:CheY-like chemotaxis protein